MTASTRRAKTVTQADIIVVMIAQEIKAIDDRIAEAMPDRDEVVRLRSQRNVLAGLKGKIERYLDGDLSVLVR
jgi:hypothetical protein